MTEIEEWLKQTILSVETISNTPTNKDNAERKMNELQNILDQLEEKEKDAKLIQKDCESYGYQYGDVQSFVRNLLLGLNTNITVIRENQIIIRTYIENLIKPSEVLPPQEPEIVTQEPIEEIKIEQQKFPIEESIEEIKIQEQELIAEPIELPVEVPLISEKISTVETVSTMTKPETQAMSTQTIIEKQPTDNFMVIQSMNADGETIQIYNMPSPFDDSKDHEKNVIVEAKYVRDHSGDTKRASELSVKNVPKHFETTFVEPDETTTEIIVDPDGTKRIIVRKFTRVTNQIVKQEVYEEGEGLPEHLRAQLSVSKTTHDVIVPDSMALEQHPGITESSLSAVIEHVSHRIIKKTRKIIKKVTIINGKEEITEEVIEEPDVVEEFSEERPAIEYEVSQTLTHEPILISETIESEPLQIIEEKIIVESSEELKPEHEVTFEIIEPQVELKEEPQEIVAPSEVEQIIEEQQTEKIIETPTDVEEPQIESRVDTEEPAGEKPNEQVFETLTEAPVDFVASEVDKLAPLENIQNIWPYETPHITPQSTVCFDTPVVTAKDQGSESIWPHNMAIGSNINLNEYSFERTVDRLSDNLVTDNVVPIDTGVLVEELSQKIDILPMEEPKIEEPIKELEQHVDITPEEKDEIIEEVISHVVPENENIEIISDEIIKEELSEEIIIEELPPQETQIPNEKTEIEEPKLMIEKEPIDIEKKSPEKEELLEAAPVEGAEILINEAQNIEAVTVTTEEEPIVETPSEIHQETLIEINNYQEKLFSDEPSDTNEEQKIIIITKNEILVKQESFKEETSPQEVILPSDEQPEEILEVPQEVETKPIEEPTPSVSEPLVVEIKSPPTSPIKQMATITIVKTKTFLEIEKQNADNLIPETIEKAIMIVRTPEPSFESETLQESSKEPQEEIIDVIKEQEPLEETLTALKIDEVPSEISESVPQLEEPLLVEEITAEEVIKTLEDPPQPQELSIEPIASKEMKIIETISEPSKEEIVAEKQDTFHVLLKVDPTEVTKINVNITERSPPKEIIEEVRKNLKLKFLNFI